MSTRETQNRNVCCIGTGGSTTICNNEGEGIIISRGRSRLGGEGAKNRCPTNRTPIMIRHVHNDEICDQWKSIPITD